MAKYRVIWTNLWNDPIVLEEMTPEDKLFYVYLLTGPCTTQTGIYRITKKQIAFELGYSIDSVQLLMERFIHHYKLIRYNPETRELAIKNWGKENLHKCGKAVMDCITKELKDVKDISLIQYVAESIEKEEIRNIYDSFCEPEESLNEEDNQNEENIFEESECEDPEEASLQLFTIRGEKEKQKENKKENKKEKQQQKEKQKAPAPTIEKEQDLDTTPSIVVQGHTVQTDDVKEIIEFWDKNGFGLSNLNAKEQLLLWLTNSSFLQPKAVILKAMEIACANNKRRLNYVAGILRNWENESLLTVEEIDLNQENERSLQKFKQSTNSFPAGRAIPSGFVLDITAGEEE
ncbi:DnaD domain protein [Virgibacillus sp. 6R]|uniref:DnaD domain protein n=1 Tax=Metabacillus sp. 22489 TaxID=3453928 RepID=UPI00210406D1